ncbi:TauD/TfdA family dioxygenase [Polymorphospora sp. NPDC051019]|uniref:TauD/TfdA family dioxygenase n=1 Tax=Polymorphospora sp. NPDC051019 TaxID=3155725 RepID=UPI00344176B4
MLRWDPRTCKVARREWQQVAEIIEATPPTSDVAWQPGRVAFIDNRRNLHRRPPIKAAGTRKLRRLYVY